MSLGESVPLSGGDQNVGKGVAKFGVLTVSDRASAGTYEDRSGPEILRFFGEAIRSAWVAVYNVIPDEYDLIQKTLKYMADEEDCCLIVTTGGTGPALRDVTPEATEAVCDRLMPGYAEQMRAISLKVVPTAVLSRQTAGLRGDTLILNLPGKPKAIRETIDEVFVSVPACIGIMKEHMYIETNDSVVKAFRPGKSASPMQMEDDCAFKVAITPHALDVAACTDWVRHESCGAVATFLGTTRDTFDGKRVTRLEYEAYEPMAKKKMWEVCEHARSRWNGIARMGIWHRIGTVPVKESSVLIAVSSAHRKDALECCAWAIDELKATVPIWKKEIYEGGEVWKENAESRARLMNTSS
eukprot:jgi/Picre1/30924/NNA_006283.t1